MNRRRVLGVLGGGVGFAVAGCVGDDSGTDDVEGDGTGSDRTDSDGTDSDGTDDSEPSVDDSTDGADDAAVELAEIDLRLVGLTAEGLSFDSGDEGGIHSTVASELDLLHQSVRVDASAGTVELTTGERAVDEFVEALTVAGLSVDHDQVREGVTEFTRKATLDALDHRFEDTADEVSVRAVGDLETEPQVQLAVDESDSLADVHEAIDDRKTVEIVAGFPPAADGDDQDGGLDTIALITSEGFSSIGTAEPPSASHEAHVPVTLTPDAAERFVDTMKDVGFTDDGIGQCFFDAKEDDSYREDEFCLYTVVDDELVSGASMSPDLAQTLVDDREGFLEDPQFIMTTGSMAEAEALERALRTAGLPTEVESIDE